MPDRSIRPPARQGSPIILAGPASTPSQLADQPNRRASKSTYVPKTSYVYCKETYDHNSNISFYNKIFTYMTSSFIDGIFDLINLIDLLITFQIKMDASY